MLEDVDSNVDEVELMEDGSFRAVTAGREHPAGVVPVDIDSAQEDNDDDCLIVGFTPGATPKPARLCPKQELREIVEDLLREGGAAVQEQVRGAEAAAPAQAEESDDSDIIFVEEVQGNPALPPAAPRRQRHVPTSSSSSSDSDDDARKYWRDISSASLSISMNDRVSLRFLLPSHARSSGGLVSCMKLRKLDLPYQFMDMYGSGENLYRPCNFYCACEYCRFILIVWFEEHATTAVTWSSHCRL